MSQGQLIKALRIKNDMTQDELAERIGVSAVSVRKWERGSVKPQWDCIVALSRLFGVSSDTLLGIQTNWVPTEPLFPGEERLLKMFRKLDQHGAHLVTTVCAMELDRVKQSQMSTPKQVVEFPKRGRWLRHYLVSPAAGSSANIGDSPYDDEFFEGDIPASADYCVTISGNSMAPYLLDGQVAFVQEVEELSVGDVGIFDVDGAMYCKILYRKPDGTTILASANPDLKHTNVILNQEGDSSVRCCGRVLLSQRVVIPDYLYED